MSRGSAMDFKAAQKVGFTSNTVSVASGRRAARISRVMAPVPGPTSTMDRTLVKSISRQIFLATCLEHGRGDPTSRQFVKNPLKKSRSSTHHRVQDENRSDMNVFVLERSPP